MHQVRSGGSGGFGIRKAGAPHVNAIALLSSNSFVGKVIPDNKPDEGQSNCQHHHSDRQVEEQDASYPKAN